MNTALELPVSASVSHGRPRSNSLLPRSTLPEIELGEDRLTTLPTRVGMLRVCAEAIEARVAVRRVVWSFIVRSVGGKDEAC